MNTNTYAERAEAEARYKEDIKNIKIKWPHTPNGDCTSDCRRTGCPNDEIPTFEGWLENQ